MRCEVCGCRIDSRYHKVIIEGAKLTVCVECAKLGKPYHEEPNRKMSGWRMKTAPAPLKIQVKKTQTPKVDTSFELVENSDTKIRQAREKLGLSHEELGKRINEKVSLLRKIETGKMTPDNKLATILEHALKIKLIVPTKEEKVPMVKMARVAGREVTLGDLVQLNKKRKEREDTTGRKPS